MSARLAGAVNEIERHAGEQQAHERLRPFHYPLHRLRVLLRLRFGDGTYHLSQSDSEQQPEVADGATEDRVERKTTREPVGLARGVPVHGHRLRHERQAEQIVHQRQAAEYELEYEYFPVGEFSHVRTSLSLCALVRPHRKTRASSSTLVFSS